VRDGCQAVRVDITTKSQGRQLGQRAQAFEGQTPLLIFVAERVVRALRHIEPAAQQQDTCFPALKVDHAVKAPHPTWLNSVQIFLDTLERWFGGSGQLPDFWILGWLPRLPQATMAKCYADQYLKTECHTPPGNYCDYPGMPSRAEVPAKMEGNQFFANEEGRGGGES